MDLNRSHQEAAGYLPYWVYFTEAENTQDGVRSLHAFEWPLRESTREWKWLFGPAIIHVPRKSGSVLWDIYYCPWWVRTVLSPGGIYHFGNVLDGMIKLLKFPGWGNWEKVFCDQTRISSSLYVYYTYMVGFTVSSE